MNNPNANSPVSPAAAWRGRQPGLYEFNALLNLVNTAALVIDREREMLVLANSGLLRLTAYSQNELIGQPLSLLLPDMRREHYSNPDEQVFMLNRRARTPQRILVRVRKLDAASQWLVMFLTPEENSPDVMARRSLQLFGAMEGLVHLSCADNLKQAMQQSVEVVSHFLNAGLVCIYHTQNDQPHLEKIATSETANIFPAVYTQAIDLNPPVEPTMWTPGKRVVSDLQRAARIANLAYVITSPIIEEVGGRLNCNGLLVAADVERPADEQWKALMQILTTQFDSLFKHFILAETLQSENTRLREALSIHTLVNEHLRDGVLTVSPDHTVQDMNPAAENMLGYAVWEVQGHPLTDILIGLEDLNTVLDNAWQGQEPAEPVSGSLHRRNGQSFPVEVQVYPLKKGDVTGTVVITIADMSEREEIRLRTQQLEHRAILGEALAAFAHEMRQPINGISSGMQLLEVKLPPELANSDVFMRITGECTRLSQRMESVLSFARQPNYKFEPVDMRIFLQIILDRWRLKLSRSNIRGTLEVEPSCPPVLGDSRMLDQVFTNLVSNAEEAMRTRGSGSLNLRVGANHSIPNKPQVEITVADDGPGIPEEVRRQVFDPFVTTKDSGTGLGLAITHRIVTGHHGTITVDSVPGGTVFHILLPAVPGSTA